MSDSSAATDVRVPTEINIGSHGRLSKNHCPLTYSDVDTHRGARVDQPTFDAARRQASLDCFPHSSRPDANHDTDRLFGFPLDAWPEVPDPERCQEFGGRRRIVNEAP